jgi:hypothetical protein
VNILTNYQAMVMCNIINGKLKGTSMKLTYNVCELQHQGLVFLVWNSRCIWKLEWVNLVFKIWVMNVR